MTANKHMGRPQIRKINKSACQFDAHKYSIQRKVDAQLVHSPPHRPDLFK